MESVQTTPDLMLELPDVWEFQFSGDTDALVKDVHDLAKRVKNGGPQGKQLAAGAHQKLLAERVFCGIALAGNTLTLKETAEILASGNLPNFRKKEATAARNLGRAIELMERQFLVGPPPHTEENFLLAHETLMEELDEGGKYRAEAGPQVSERQTAVKPELAPMLVRIMLSSLTEETFSSDSGADAVRLAAWTHWAIARIEPFAHGSGRLARLWQDLILQRAGLGPATIRPVDRQRHGYGQCMARADGGDLNPLVQLVAQRCAATLADYLAAQRQGDDLDAWANRLAEAPNVETAERRRASYLRWARQMEGLQADFERCLARITSRGIEAQFASEPLIDQETWDAIRSGTAGEPAAYFSVEFRQRDKRHRYVFAFDRHQETDCDCAADKAEARTGLVILEQVGSAAPQIMRSQKGNPILLREIFTVENWLISVLAKNGVDGAFNYDRNAEGIKLAMEFIEQVLLKRMAA